MAWNTRKIVSVDNKSSGPKMLPCGTPQVIGSWADVAL